MKYSERLRILLTCTAKHNVQNSGMAAAYAKGVIEGAVTCLMAQGATWERAGLLCRRVYRRRYRSMPFRKTGH